MNINAKNVRFVVVLPPEAVKKRDAPTPSPFVSVHHRRTRTAAHGETTALGVCAGGRHHFP